MTGVSATQEKAYLRTESSGTAFLSNSLGAQQKNTSFASKFTIPSEEIEYKFSLRLVRTETGLSFGVSYNDENEQTVSFSETSISTFDVIGVRANTTPGGKGITLSNLSITTTGTVIPEPSLFGFLAGIGAVALVCARRKRK